MAHLGLTINEAERALQKYGPNDVSEDKKGVVKKFLAPLYSPISLMLLGAALLSYFGKRFFDCYFILGLYFLNYVIQKWQEFKADKAIAQLRSRLSFEVWTLRDGKWVFVNAKKLVPGDYIRLGLGSMIPADAEVLSCKNLSINEAVLSGESMPKTKRKGDKIFSGSFVATGNVQARVTATGKNTYFGKTIFSIEQPNVKSILEKDILTIARFLTAVSLIAVCILSTAFILKGFNLNDLLILDISLVIAGIPIALPAVMAIILSIGAAKLALKQVIVRRLSALQDLANVNLLLTDKTGTLTKNEIRVANVVSYIKGVSTDHILEMAGYAVPREAPDAIDSAILNKLIHMGKISDISDTDGAEVIKSVPYDSDRKRSTALVQVEDKKILISLGAPQVVQALSKFKSRPEESRFEKDVYYAAESGYRTLAVAIKKKGGRLSTFSEKNMEIAGLIFLADPLDETSKETLHFMKKNGIDVKIVTGDNVLITKRIVGELGLHGQVLSEKEVQKFYKNDEDFSNWLADVSAFAQIMPKDKLELVKSAKKHFIVASTGDGINDLPALRVANVGIAVSGAVSALKSMADIVLLGHGLAVIKDAILESRKIFSRLYTYSVYRISESFRLIVTIFILGLAYGFYPLLPLQIILLAFLNDIPIISLALDKVKISQKPSEIKTKERFILSLLFGSVGTANSILLFLLAFAVHLPLPIIQTMFFLKLTVSGHSLIFVAHTKERWWKFLPSKEVITATVATQIFATILALTGFLMPVKISWVAVVFVWVWALIWMQVSEFMKDLQKKFIKS